MKVILIIAIVVIVLMIKSSINKKIDQIETNARATPGVANRIRTKFPDVVSMLLSLDDADILFERDDMIKIGLGDESHYIHLSDSFEKFSVTYVGNGSVQKSWSFNLNENQKHIIYEIAKYFDNLNR